MLEAGAQHEHQQYQVKDAVGQEAASVDVNLEEDASQTQQQDDATVHQVHAVIGVVQQAADTTRRSGAIFGHCALLTLLVYVTLFVILRYCVDVPFVFEAIHICVMEYCRIKFHG